MTAPGKAALAAALLATGLCLTPSVTRAQSVSDGSEATIGAQDARVLLALLGKHLRSPDARVSSLRKGRGGALCGAVDVRNRMGDYTGPRGFVADLVDGFVGRLPEGPELRAPASMADFKAMERARTLFAANCTAE